ncbi:MAG: hypothetical protein PHY23_02790 [Oscillospiraceae bacterium]|nr:hypothetical protein [Oscillospiraceae bacterium]
MAILCLSIVAVAAEGSKVKATDDFSQEIAATLSANNISKEQAVRLNTVINDMVSNATKAFDIDTSRKTAAIKVARDFAGNIYTVVETAPTGYFIYHNGSGNFVDYSPLSPSPYSGYEGDNLYYGGPTQYYVLQDGYFVHTVIDEKYPAFSKADFAKTSQKANAAFLAESNDTVVEYVKNGTSAKTAAYQTQAAAATTYAYIPYANQISSLTTNSKMGNISVPKGACGYVATSIVLLWLKKAVNTNFVTYNNSTGLPYTASSGGLYYYIGNPNNPKDGKSLSYNLWRWHSGTGHDRTWVKGDFDSYPWTIHNTISSYCASRGLTLSHGYELLQPSTSVRNYLRNYNRPYILFGDLKVEGSTADKVDHAVTVYGYSTDQEYIVSLM